MIKKKQKRKQMLFSYTIGEPFALSMYQTCMEKVD